jgi:predicted RNA-binding protein (virulence factor B family)
MHEIGKINRLKVSRESPHGLYLFWDKTEVLLPKKYITDEIRKSGFAEVIVYTDSEDRLVATTEKPYATVGEHALLRIVARTDFGAFADWGLEKNLFIPLREQAKPLHEGDWAFLKVCLDFRTGRPFGSTKWRSLMQTVTDEIDNGDEIRFVVAERTPLGFLCIVNDEFEGLLHAQDAPLSCEVGKKFNGFAKRVREDGKIDILLRKEGVEGLKDEGMKIVELLKENDGVLPFDDKSAPEEIQNFFGMSKKTFKRAAGMLLKEKKIRFDDGKLLLV